MKVFNTLIKHYALGGDGWTTKHIVDVCKFVCHSVTLQKLNNNKRVPFILGLISLLVFFKMGNILFRIFLQGDTFISLFGNTFNVSVIVAIWTIVSITHHTKFDVLVHVKKLHLLPLFQLGSCLRKAMLMMKRISITHKLLPDLFWCGVAFNSLVPHGTKFVIEHILIRSLDKKRSSYRIDVFEWAKNFACSFLGFWALANGWKYMDLLWIAVWLGWFYRKKIFTDCPKESKAMDYDMHIP